MAIQNPTTNYSWTLPTVGASTGTWGTTLNTVLGDDSTGIDAVVKAVSDVADAALAKAGGTMSGPLKLLETQETINAIGSVSGALNVDCEAGGWATATVTGAITDINLTNPPASGTGIFIVLELTDDGSGTGHALTWGSEWDFPGGTAYSSLTDGGVDIFVLFTRDAFTNAFAVRVGQDFS